MSDNPEMLDYSNICFSGAQQQTNNLLSDPNFVSLLQKLVERHLPVIAVPIIRRFGESFLRTLEPMMENSVRNVVKEQLDIAVEKLNARARMPGDETQTSEPRHLELKFLDGVCLPVYTGREIKAEGGNHNIRIELVDAEGNLVSSGLEASSDVEIMVLPEGINDGASSSARGGSDPCKLSGKKRPSPVLSIEYLKLKEGRAVLDGMKFKHKTGWTKSCNIKLVARTVEKFLQTTVKAAETEIFLVEDYRNRFCKKHHTPLLSDKVWRLKLIRRDGKLHKRLQLEKIDSVEAFLISHNMDPQTLQQKLAINAEKFRVIVEHAKTCKIPGELYEIHYFPSRERYVSVVFDAVRCVRGLLDVDGRFVPVDGLAEADKVAAQKMVISAFQHKMDIQLYDTEASTSNLPAQVPSDVDTSISPWLGSSSAINMGPNETTDGLVVSPLSHLMQTINDVDSFNYCFSETGVTEFPFTWPEMGLDNLFNLDISQSADPRIEAHNVQNTGTAVCKGSSADSSKKAKGRWKMVVISVRFSVMAVRKRIEALEDAHAHKKQRRC